MTARLREAVDLTIDEKTFQQQIVDLAHHLKWMTYHTFDSRRSAPGLPDLILCQRATPTFAGQHLMLEVKTMKGIVSAAQIRWQDALRSAGVEVRVVRPSDWDWIVARLKEKRVRLIDVDVAS